MDKWHILRHKLGLILISFLITPGAFALTNNALVVGDAVADLAATCPAPCQASEVQALKPPTRTRINNHNIEQYLIDQYRLRWGINLTKPAYVFTKNNLLVQGKTVRAWTSVAYLNNTRYRLYVGTNGAVLGSAVNLRFNPVSIQRTLTVVVDHGNTNIAEVMDTLLVDAQNVINADHAEHAADISWPEPIAGFEFINLLVSASEFADPLRGPKTPADVYALLTSKGLILEDYDLIVVMDPDPANPAGGFAFFGGNWAYIGWFLGGSDGFVTLTESDLGFLARALYHHEVGHAWGWEHSWDGNNLSYNGPLIVNPILFGWTDTDGDGIPEILDDTPYGSF